MPPETATRPETARPRRSALFVPATNLRAQEKAKTLAADVLIFDLEDSVAPEVKETAREQLLPLLAAGGYGGREIVVRVNALDSQWAEADLAAVSRASVHGVLLPKVDSADDIHRAEAALNANGAPGDLAIWCMMETPRGVLNAQAIAAASPRLTCLAMGTSDLAKDLHAAHTPDRLPFLTSLGLCVLAARAAGVAILDSVYLDLNDEAGFAAICRQGRELGFDGKTVIHPKQLAATNETFSPGADELAWAEKIIAAYGAAAAAGKGVVVVDGQLIEHLHAAEARRLQAMAAAIKELEAALA